MALDVDTPIDRSAVPDRSAVEDGADAASPTHRRMSFAYGDDFDPYWHPQLPELAAAANAVSFMMPHAEPYVAKAVRRGAADAGLSERAAHEAEIYVRQELEHHRQHRIFNDLVIARYPSIRRLDRVLAWTFRRLENRSAAFGLAFAAGFETIAYTGARWTDARLRRLFGGADPTAATMFLWHLAEEIEHKNVAFDVMKAADVGFFRRLAGVVSASVLLASFAIVGTWMLLIAQRRFHSPVAHARLIGWTFSFLFEAVPAMAVSLLPSHHPSSLSDPSWFAQWLETYDDDTNTMPLWNS